MNIKLSETNNVSNLNQQNIDNKYNFKNENKDTIQAPVPEKTEAKAPVSESEVDITLMNQLQRLKTESSTNQDKIARLKTEISSNQYSVDINRLSSKIREFETQLQKLND